MEINNINNYIFPIIRHSEKGVPLEFAGTGFFVGNDEDILVMTAAHIIDLCPLSEGEKYWMAIASASEGIAETFALPEFKKLPGIDIAFAGIKNTENFKYLKFSSGDTIPLNEGIVSYDFSSTIIQKPVFPNEKHKLLLEPISHRGHPVRFYLSKFPEKSPTFCLETSFPVLQGASGAPVLRESNLTVIGVMVANIERQLIPAQTISIKDGETFSSETRYFLPYGKAVSAKEIINAMKSSGITFG